MRVVIGVDPDSKKHGIAIYYDGELDDLLMLELYECMELMDAMPDALWAIEHVTKSNAVFGKNKQNSFGGNAQVGRGIGLCQQSMTELVRMLQHKKIEYKLIPPTRDNWTSKSQGKNGLARFQRLTGWDKRSNPEKRSAAYFGYLASR